MRTAGLKKDKPSKPPEPLQDRTQQGAARCRYWDMRRKPPEDPRAPLVFFQCGRAARKGWAVCCYHGAGSAKREKQGISQRPGVANVITGAHSTRATINALLDQHPEARARYEYWKGSPALFDFRELIAMSRAMIEHYAKRANLDLTEMKDGSDPPNLRVITAIRQCIENTERMVALEKSLTPVLNADVEYFLDCISILLAEFVPRKRLAQSRERLTELLRRREPGSLGSPLVSTG